MSENDNFNTGRDDDGSDLKNKKYALLAPDGGWGYMICIAGIIIHTATTGFSAVFGMIFNDFMEEVNIGSTDVTLVNGIQALNVALFGFLSGPLQKVMSARQLILTATILFNIGTLGLVFATTKTEFFLHYGILSGAGYGIAFNVVSTALNDYFVQKRMFAFNLTQSITALLTMAAPIFTKLCLETYGYTGTALLRAGVSLQMFISVALIQPVKIHMKKEVLQQDNRVLSYIIIGSIVHKCKFLELAVSAGLLAELKLPLLNKDINDKSKITESSKHNMTKSVEGSMRKIESTGIRATIEKYFDTAVLIPFLKSNASRGPALSLFCELCFISIFPQALYSLGWDNENATIAVTLLTFGDLAMRILFIMFNKWLSKFKSREIYLCGVFVAIVTRLVMLLVKNKWVMFVSIAAMGTARYTNMTFMHLVIAEVVSPENFSTVMGAAMLIFGVVSVVLGPIIGAVRDVTDSYSVAYYIIISILAFVLASWSLELFLEKNKQKRITREKKEKPSKMNK